MERGPQWFVSGIKGVPMWPFADRVTFNPLSLTLQITWQQLLLVNSMTTIEHCMGFYVCKLFLLLHRKSGLENVSWEYDELEWERLVDMVIYGSWKSRGPFQDDSFSQEKKLFNSVRKEMMSIKCKCLSISVHYKWELSCLALPSSVLTTQWSICCCQSNLPGHICV